MGPGDAPTRLLRVALFAPVHIQYTYRPPGDAPSDAQPGCRVVVPFGNRHANGIVTGFADSAPEGVPLKAVVTVVDREPVLDGAQLELGEWMARRWFTPPGECYNLFFPPGSSVDTTYAYSPTAAGIAWTSPPGRTPFRDKVLALVRARPGSLKHELARLIPAPGLDRALSDLEKAGLLCRELRVGGSRTGFRQVRFLDLVSPSVDPSAFPARQRAALEFIRSHETPLPVFRVVREAGVGHDVVKALEKKGVLRVFTGEDYRDPFRHYEARETEDFTLTTHQREAVRRIGERIRQRAHGKFLMLGVTGSGKTQVYIELIGEALSKGRTAVMLVPEIALTPALTRRFLTHFGSRLALFHSMLSEGERHDQWHRLRRGEARVVVGTRSALFAPLKDPGVVILDEEHDGSYKQDETPRYHARDVAARWAELTGAALVLGSATPAVESFHGAVESGRYELVELPERILSRPLPEVHVVDLAVEFQRFGKGIVIAGSAFRSISDRMRDGEQVMVLLNRRGFSPLLLCRKCGNTLLCAHCNISMTYHAGENRMLCHYCGFVRPVPGSCPDCGSAYLQYIGLGTEKLQELFSRKFPGKRVERFDRDTTRERGSMKAILERFERREIDLLVGTQMIAKGHDFPGVTLVVVLSTDISLRIADFRSAERTFQLLTQVAGRSGRGETPGEVYIQTYYPNHYAVRFARCQDYRQFYTEEIRFRKRLLYPPFSRIVFMTFSGRSETEARRLAEGAGARLREVIRERGLERDLRVVGPVPAFLEKIKDAYRFSLMVRCFRDEGLHDALIAFRDRCARAKLNWRMVTVDVDPMTLS